MSRSYSRRNIFQMAGTAAATMIGSRIAPAQQAKEPQPKIDPELMKHLKSADTLVYEDGALPRKIKLLMAMAFDAVNGAAAGVKALAASAMQAGATKQEIAEAIRVAYHLGGIGSVYAASQGLKELFP